jgi:hypothetical protein
MELVLPARVPGLGDYAQSNASIGEIVPFKWLSVYFPFTAWKDSFACIDAADASVV